LSLWNKQQTRRDRSWELLGRSAALFAGGIVLLIAAFVAFQSLPALHWVGVSRLLFDSSWHPTPNPGTGQFGLAPMLAASFAVSLAAMLWCAPIGLMIASFTATDATGAVARFYRYVLEVLTGIPSVIFGFWGLVCIVPLLASWHAPGASLLAGALCLGLMILPTLALLADEVLRSVPDEHRRAAAALGLDRTVTLWCVIIPAAQRGLRAALLLSTARALGETMVVLMVTGNVVQWPGSPFTPVRTLTANIALELGYALGAHRSALFAGGLLLTAAVCGLVLLSLRSSDSTPMRKVSG